MAPSNLFKMCRNKVYGAEWCVSAVCILACAICRYAVSDSSLSMRCACMRVYSALCVAKCLTNNKYTLLVNTTTLTRAHTHTLMHGVSRQCTEFIYPVECRPNALVYTSCSCIEGRRPSRKEKISYRK